MKKVLTIAGSDSGAGAGIQADLKTISSLGLYGTTAITAITAQNTLGVQRVDFVSATSVKAQIQSILQDIGADAIKIGMLGHEEIIEVVAETLLDYSSIPVVLDPVMVATSGDELTKSSATNSLIKNLFPLARLVTPNIYEASKITNTIIKSRNDIKEACIKISLLGAKNILLKGGDFKSEEATDLFFESENKTFETFTSVKIQTKNTHGTGCSLSSAIASYLAMGKTLVESVRLAKDYLFSAIKDAQEQKVGQGRGPVSHFWKNNFILAFFLFLSLSNQATEKFSKKSWNSIHSLYEKIYHHPFNQQLAQGSLDKKKFAFYKAQDAYYLHHYSKVLSLLASKMDNPKEMQEVLRFAGSVFSEDLSKTKIDIKDITPGNFAYTNFLLKTAALSTKEEIAAAVFPCFIIYGKLAEDLKKISVEDNPFQSWIDLYSSKKFAKDIEIMGAILDRLYQMANKETQKKMEDAYILSSHLELAFWEDSFTGKKLLDF